MKRKKIIEIIEIRSADKDNIFNKISFTDLVESIGKNIKIEKMILLRHKTIETDFCLHLCYESEDCYKDSAGIHLSSLFKEWGLVHHSVWIEEESFILCMKTKNEYKEEEFT